MADIRKAFTSVVSGFIHRDGISDLMDYLENETDFFTAPASTRYHGAFEGGLAKHSFNVFKEMIDEVSAYKTKYNVPISDESAAIVSLFHDVCKANCYHKRTGKSESSAPGYEFLDPLPLGHGEKSLYIVSRFMKLSNWEAMAIRWHMGAFDNAFRGGERALNTALEACPLVLLLHVADMKATYFDERGCTK